MTRIPVVLVVAGVLLAGCADGGSAAAPGSSGDAASPPASSSAAAISPADLVGFWRVDPAGSEPAAILRLGDDLSLADRCGVLIGSWGATAAGMFLGYLFGSTGGCPLIAAGTGPAWLRQVERVSRADTGWQLSTRDGTPVARLRPAAPPAPGSGLPQSFLTRPRATAPPSTPPASVRPPSDFRPAGHAALLGRWAPASRVGIDDRIFPFVRLAANGSWVGSDGCNADAGRWTSGPDGAVLAVSGMQTLIGCAGVPAGGWLTGASRAGFRGGTLILLDAHGAPNGRLVPDRPVD